MSFTSADLEPLLPDLMRYARSLVRNEDDAQDLVQDCVERAMVKSHLYKEGTNLRSWLFTLLRNVFISRKRRDAVARRYVQHELRHGQHSAPAPQSHHVFLQEAIAALRDLAEGEREAITALGIDQRSHRFVAEQLNVPVGTVKSRLSRGRANLRLALDLTDGGA